MLYHLKNIIRKKVIIKLREEQLSLKEPDLIILKGQVQQFYRKRMFVIQQIMETENDYINNLDWVNEKIIKEVKRELGQIETERLFSNIEEILKVNKKFQYILKNRLAIENKKYYQKYGLKIKMPEYGHENSKLFYNENKDLLLEGFWQYIQYSIQYSECSKLRDEYQVKIQIYQSIIKSAQNQKNDESEFKIEHLLIQPCLRIRQYNELFSQLKQYTPGKKFLNSIKFQHPDYENICLVLQQFQYLENAIVMKQIQVLKNTKIFHKYINKQKIQQILMKQESKQQLIETNKLFLNQIKKINQQRRFVIKEFFENEENYLKDLEWINLVVIEEFKKAFGSEETIKLFSNIEEIINVNKKFLNKLQTRLALENEKCYQNYAYLIKRPEFGHEFSVLFQDDGNLLMGFEKYFEYCRKYSFCSRLRKKYQASNEIYQQILQNAKFAKNDQFEFEIENFLSKPFQRIARYPITLAELEKKTDAFNVLKLQEDKIEFYHPDYQNICQLLQKFEELNKQNDKSVGKIMRIYDILNEDPQGKIILSDNNIRELVSEHIVQFYDNQNKILTYLVCSTDLIILLKVEQNDNKIIEKQVLGIFLFSLTSQINKVDSQQGYVFKISTKENVLLFQASNKIEYEEIEKNISLAIQNFIQLQKETIQTQQDEIYDPTNVKLIGTEVFDSGNFSNFTVYIIEITLEKFKWLLFYRYSQLKIIQTFILNKDMQANITKLNKQFTLFVQDYKYIEEMKINIEAFIQSIFKWKKFSEYKQQLLQLLGMPINFNLLTNLFDQQNKLQNQLNSFQSSDLVSSFKKISDLLYRINQKFLEKLEFVKIVGSISQQEKEEKTLMIQIMSLVLKRTVSEDKRSKIFNGQFLKLTVDRNIRAIEFCEIIAKEIQLDFFEDFRLQLQDSEGNCRVLENDQIVCETLSKDDIFGVQHYSEECSSAFELCTKVVKQLLKFQKYIFYPVQMEKILYQKNQSRLELIINYIIESRNSRLNIFVNQNKEEDNHFYFDKDESNALFLNGVKSQIRDNQEKIQQYYNQFYLKLIEIQSKNQQVIQNSTQSNNILLNESNQLFLTIENLAKLTLANLAFKQPLFGANQFYVGISKESNHKNSQIGYFHNNLPNIYLAINWKSLLLLHPNKLSILLNIPIQDIKETLVESVKLTINFQNQISSDFNLIFRTKQGYRISNLINQYQEINNLFKNFIDQ